MEFDRWDICEAYAVLERDWNLNGWVKERPSNRRRKMSTGVQLSRMGFSPRCDLSYETLSDNGKEIYDNLEIEYKLIKNLDN